MAKIKIKNLKVAYKNKNSGDIIVLNDFNLDIEEGTFNVILGFSGCGKTTLLRVLAGFLDYEGEIYFDDIDVNNLTTQERNISYVSQQYILYPHLTIFDNIASPLKIAKAPRKEIIERVHEIASFLDIEQCLSRKPRHLSGGQQQKVALARALIKKSQLYLFDEPLSNFDAIKRNETRMMIKRIAKEHNLTSIYVTHDFDEAISLADNIIIINDGKVEITGTPEEILKSKNLIVNQLKWNKEKNE